jgi:hypothetical protein
VSRQELVSAIRTQARRQATRARNVFRGVVVDTSPLKIELLHDDEVLTPDDYELSQWIKSYDERIGLALNDNVLLSFERAEWVVFDVIADEDAPALGGGGLVEGDGINIAGDTISVDNTVARDSDLAAHEADTTNVHGIPDTGQLVTDADLTTHEADTSNVHGITDTTNLAYENVNNNFPTQTIGDVTNRTLRVGDVLGANNFAGVQHSALAAGTSYALLQSSAGATFLNAASGQTITYRVNNATVATMSATTFTVSAAGFIFDAPGSAQVIIDANATTDVSDVLFRKNGVARWWLRGGNTTAESGSNEGSDLAIISATDAGAVLESPLMIDRSSGVTTLKELALTNDLALSELAKPPAAR